MAARTGLVVDSACDLPHWFIEQNDIAVLPISIRIDDDVWVDARDPARTLEFYESDQIARSHDAESVPFSTQEIETLFLDRVVTAYDAAIIETVTRSRSPIYENAQHAAHGILAAYRPIRRRSGLDETFSLRVINTRTLFTGQAVIAAHTMERIREGARLPSIRQSVEALAGRVYAYAVPPDVFYLRERARRKGDDSVSWMGATVARAFDVKPILCAREEDTYPVARVRGHEAGMAQLFEYARRRIERGLSVPYVCVSYAGDPAALERLPQYQALQETAEAHRVQVLTAIMCLTGGVNLGPGTLSLALAAPPHDFA